MVSCSNMNQNPASETRPKKTTKKAATKKTATKKKQKRVTLSVSVSSDNDEASPSSRKEGTSGAGKRSQCHSHMRRWTIETNMTAKNRRDMEEKANRISAKSIGAFFTTKPPAHMLCCHCCMQMHTSTPAALPVECTYHHNTIVISFIHAFCDWHCVRAYNRSLTDVNMTKRETLIALAAKHIHKVPLTSTIHPAPSRLALNVFGGSMSREQFNSAKIIQPLDTKHYNMAPSFLEHNNNNPDPLTKFIPVLHFSSSENGKKQQEEVVYNKAIAQGNARSRARDARCGDGVQQFRNKKKCISLPAAAKNQKNGRSKQQNTLKRVLAFMET